MKAAYQYMVRTLQWPPIRADFSRQGKATLEKSSSRLIQIESRKGTGHIYSSSGIPAEEYHNVPHKVGSA